MQLFGHIQYLKINYKTANLYIIEIKSYILIKKLYEY
jgi:hypothetical protein